MHRGQNKCAGIIKDNYGEFFVALAHLHWQSVFAKRTNKKASTWLAFEIG